jgi:copper oxidase (laccase) domain-containing protein
LLTSGHALDAGHHRFRTLWRPAAAPRGAIVAATTRRGGVSAPPFDALNLGRSTADAPDAVEENRRRVLAALGIPEGRVATAGQVHGVRVTEVKTPGLHVETDALVTRSRTSRSR